MKDTSNINKQQIKTMFLELLRYDKNFYREIKEVVNEVIEENDLVTISVAEEIAEDKVNEIIDDKDFVTNDDVENIVRDTVEDDDYVTTDDVKDIVSEELDNLEIKILR